MRNTRTTDFHPLYMTSIMLYNGTRYDSPFEEYVDSRFAFKLLASIFRKLTLRREGAILELCFFCVPCG